MGNETNWTNASTSTFIFYGYPVVVPLAMLMVFFIVLSIGGNIMVILTIVGHRGLRTRTNMFIINLAVADVLVAVLDMPVSLVTVLKGDWVFGDGMCQLNGFTMALFLICSIHTLMYISIHKFISITRPFSRAMTPKRIKLMIAASWIWAIFCATGPLLGWNHVEYKKGASQCGPDIPRDKYSQLHSVFITSTNYFLPLTVMCFCYFRIFREIHSHMNRIRDTSNINLATSVAQQQKVSTTLFLVLACFFLCWTPFVVYSTVAAFMKNKSTMPLVINPLAYWCGYMNSACNPIIYAFRSPSFRQGYKSIICGGKDSLQVSKGHSLSFRSKSGRGSTSTKTSLSGSRRRNVPPSEGVHGKSKKPFLAQTSWISMPIIPYLMRSFSSARADPTSVAFNYDQPAWNASGKSKWVCLCCDVQLENSCPSSPQQQRAAGDIELAEVAAGENSVTTCQLNDHGGGITPIEELENETSILGESNPRNDPSEITVSAEDHVTNGSTSTYPLNVENETEVISDLNKDETTLGETMSVLVVDVHREDIDFIVQETTTLGNLINPSNPVVTTDRHLEDSGTATNVLTTDI